MPYLINATYSLITLYMLLLLLRWLGRWIHVDLDTPRLKWACRLTDPLLSWIRSMPMFRSTAVFDYSPLIAVLGMWMVRELAVWMLYTLSRPVS